MSKSSLRSKNWLVWLTFLLVILILGGIFLYHYFLRRPNAQLVETIPDNVEYIIQVNDNESLVKNINPILPSLNELLHLEALQGLQFFIQQFPKTHTEFIISAHTIGESTKLLMSCKNEERVFTNLLKHLKIDARNFTAYSDKKIYTHGTHYKKFYFTFQNGIFSVAEDIELLKNCIDRLKSRNNLLSNEDFAEIYMMIEKNPNQNWLVVNHKGYFQQAQKIINEGYYPILSTIEKNCSWSAFQMHIHNFEIMLSGYALMNSVAADNFIAQTSQRGNMTKYLPGHISSYAISYTPNQQQLIGNLSKNDFSKQYVDIVNALQPLENCYFTVSKDTNQFSYLAFRCDTNLMDMTLLTNDSIEDLDFRNFSIKGANIGDFPILWSKNSTHLNYYIQYHDVILFSDSILPLKSYINAINSSSIETNPYYRYTQNTLPTHNSYELFISRSSAEEWKSYFSENAQKGELIQNLKIFSLTHTEMNGRLLSTNIFIKF